MARGHTKRPQPRAERCPHGVAPAPRCGRTVALGDLRASLPGGPSRDGDTAWGGGRGPEVPAVPRPELGPGDSRDSPAMSPLSGVTAVGARRDEGCGGSSPSSFCRGVCNPLLLLPQLAQTSSTLPHHILLQVPQCCLCFLSPQTPCPGPIFNPRRANPATLHRERSPLPSSQPWEPLLRWL